MSTPSVRVEALQAPQTILGESPVWHSDEQALYWVDILAPELCRFRPRDQRYRNWPMPEEIGCFAFREAGGIVAAMRSGFHWVDPDTGAVEGIVDPEPDRPGNRFNDGKCDRAGRFWSGTMAIDFTAGAGSLYRLDPDLTWHKMLDDLTVPNGMAWSPDNKTFYLADSRRDIVYAFEYDHATGDLENRRIFISTADIRARVDGATVDRDGCYWCAHIDDWAIAQYDPDGRLMRTVSVPVQHPSMCCFGGPSLDVLYVTSLTTLLNPAHRAAQPLAGAVFAIYGTGAVGLPEAKFAG